MDRRQGRLFPCELLVEIGSIGCALDSGEVGRWDPLVVYIIKVDVLEEEMSLDVFCIGFAGTESSSRISREELDR
jgi:hypothetical protein